MAVPTMSVGDVILAEMVCQSNDGQTGINALTYLVSAVGGGGSQYSDVASGMFTIFSPLYTPLMNSLSSFRAVRLTRLSPSPRLAAVLSPEAAAVGTAGPVPLPEQVSGIIKKQTIYGGRKYRGRAYIPFPATTAVGPDGNPISTYYAALANLATEMASTVFTTVGVVTSTLVPVLLNRKPPITPISTIPLTGCVAVRGFATQRRRGFYGKKNIPV